MNTETLVHGWANGIGPVALGSALQAWAKFSGPHTHKEHKEYGCPCCLAQRTGASYMASLADISAWARDVLRHASDEEGNNAPNAAVRYDPDSGSVDLLWTGTWTTGRQFTVHIWNMSNEGPEWGVRVEWKSGTGKPSRYLNIKTLLANEGWHDSGPL